MKTMEEMQVKATYDVQEKLAIASTAVVDRHGEVIDQKGWDLKNFKDNPVMLWAHDHSIPAIGVAENMRVSKAGGEAKLVFTPKFHEATDFAKAIKYMYEGDGETAPILNSFSVGFRPIEADGTTYVKNELLEVSAVNVPANPDARMMAYKSLKSAGFKEKVIKSLGFETEVLDELTALRKDVSELQNVVKANPVNPGEKTKIKQRLSMLKVIARASDKLLEADKKDVAVNEKQLIKVIKKATEIMTVAEKDNLNG